MDLSVKLTVFEIHQVLESTINLTNLQLDSVVADNHALTLPFVSLRKLAQLDLNLSDKLTPGAVTPRTFAHPPVLCGCILCTESPKRRNRQGKHLWTYCCNHLCLRAALLGTSSPPTLQVVMTNASFLSKPQIVLERRIFPLHINIVPQKRGKFPYNARSTLVDELFKSDLSKVTFLEFGFSRNLHYVPRLKGVIECLPSC